MYADLVAPLWAVMHDCKFTQKTLQSKVYNHLQSKVYNHLQGMLTYFVFVLGTTKDLNHLQPAG